MARMHPAAQMSTAAPYKRAPNSNFGARYHKLTTTAVMGFEAAPARGSFCGSYVLMDPSKKALYTEKRPSGLDVSSDPVLGSELEAFKNDRNWILMKIVNNKQLCFHASGESLFGHFIAALTEDDIYFGAIRASVNNREKTFHFCYVGPNTGAMKKGKASLQKTAAFSVIDAHGELAYVCGEIAEITRERLVSDIARLMGVQLDAVDLLLL